MSQYRDTCWCGHHMSTHHENTGQCLGRGCNEPRDDWYRTDVTSVCPYYRDDQQHDPVGKRKAMTPKDHVDDDP